MQSDSGYRSIAFAFRMDCINGKFANRFEILFRDKERYMKMQNFLERNYTKFSILWMGQNPCEIQYRINTIDMDNLCKYKDRKGSYIYFLSVNNQVVYVGQTNVGFYNRLRQHKRHLVFDNVAVLKLGEFVYREEVNKAEQYFIKRCNPILNSMLTTFEKHNCGGAKDIRTVYEWCLKNSAYFKRAIVV